MATKPKQTRSTRRCTTIHRVNDKLSFDSGCEPLTPDDVAEVVVFNAARSENVVVADTLIFPNHQVRFPSPTLFCVILATTAMIADFSLGRGHSHAQEIVMFVARLTCDRLVPAVQCTRGRYRIKHLYT